MRKNTGIVLILPILFIFLFCLPTVLADNYIVSSGYTDSSPFYPNLRVICRDGSGILHAVWQDKSNTVAYAKSTDGVTWSVNKTIVNSTGTKGNPSIDCNANKVAITYYGNAIYLSTNNGVSFTDVAPIGYEGGAYNQIFVRGSNLYLMHGNNFTYSFNLGVGWNESKAVMTDPAGLYNAMDVCGNGTSADKVYISSKSGANEVYFVNSTDYDFNFGTQIIVIDGLSGYGINHDSIVVDCANGIVHIAEDDLNGNLGYVNSTDDGITFGANITVSESVTAKDAGLTLDNNNLPWVFFHNSANFYYVKNDGSTWLSETDLGSGIDPSPKRIFDNNRIEYLYLNGSAVWYGYIDEIAPIITIQSPVNNTYALKSFWANITLNEPGSWCGFSLNNSANVTMTNSSGNWNYHKTGLSNGVYNVTFLCNDTSNNYNPPIDNPIYFTINCSCNSWVNSTCAKKGQLTQTRTCNQTCDTQSQIISDPLCVPKTPFNTMFTAMPGFLQAIVGSLIVIIVGIALAKSFLPKK